MIEGVRDWLGGRLGPQPRVFAIPGVEHPARALERHRGGHAMRVTERELGSTDHFVVHSDREQESEMTGWAVLASCERDFGAIREWFGGIRPAAQPFEVYLDDEAGGAFHYGCAGIEFHVVPDPGGAPGLLAGLLVEVFEAEQRAGWECTRTNGEALSRALAFTLHPTLAGPFTADEQEWWRLGRLDHVNQNRSATRERTAGACGRLFLHYLNAQLGIPWPRIVAAAGATLGETYELLTGFTGAQGFDDFLARLEPLERDGRLRLPATGNPFPVR